MKLHSHVRLFATPWAIAHQAPQSMGFSRHEYWSGLPFPSPGYLHDPGIESGSPTLQADAFLSELPGKQSPDGLQQISLKKNKQGSLKCAESTDKQAVSTGWFREH